MSAPKEGWSLRKFLIALAVAVVGMVFVVMAIASQRRPVVRSFSISPARFAVGASGAHSGATLRFRLSRTATVRIAINRRLGGRLSGHRCVRPSALLADRRACTRDVLVGTLVFPGQRRGRHAHPFRGRMRGRALAPGRYRATLVAIDHAHHRTRPESVPFTVVRAQGTAPPPGSGAAPTPSPAGDQFPNPSTTGVPAGWTPTQTRSSDLDVNTPGAVIEDIRLTDGADLNINARNVTVRRVELQGGMINTSDPGVVIEDTTIDRASPETNGGEGVISYCGYTAVRVAILDRNEGFRESGCPAGTPTTIRDSFVRITPPDPCGDWHGDGIQGYYGTNLHVNNVTIDFHETSSCGGTSPFFYNGGTGGSPHGHAYVNRLLLKGGGYSFRLGTPAPNSVQGLKIVDGSWHYGPIDITTVDGGGCSAISPWDAQIVKVDSNWRVTRTVSNLRCRNDNG